MYVLQLCCFICLLGLLSNIAYAENNSTPDTNGGLLLGFDQEELKLIASDAEAINKPTPTNTLTVKKNTGKEASDNLLGFDKTELNLLISGPQATPENADPRGIKPERLIIGMPTGGVKGTYYPLAKDIAKLAASRGLTIDVKPSSGSLDNIRRMASNENAGLSIVQADVLAFLSTNPSSANKTIIDNLRPVFSLYSEEIHLLARGNIKTLSDLSNKRVIVGELGSGIPITANTIFEKIGIDFEPLMSVNTEAALKKFVLGEADAIFFVGGKPISHINSLLEMKTNKALSEYTKGIHLLPIDDERLYDIYTKAEITSEDYQSKNGLHHLTKTTIPTIAVQAILVSYDFSKNDSPYYKLRCKQVNHLNSIIRENLPALAAGGNKQYHPKWADVNLNQTTKLPKNHCIQDTQPAKNDLKAIDCYLQSGSSCQ